MSAAVENEIVSMKFDNTQFEPAVKTSISTLDRLKAALNFGGQKNSGIEQLQQQANRFTMNPVTAAAGKVGGGFIAMATVAISALSNITNRAVDAGINITKALTINPAKQGFQEYEATLSSTQTIMSGTGESVGKVTASLQRLNNYADKTIYSFSDMTKNISTFTNAGLSSEKATNVIIGISNASAAAGISAEAAGRAMFGFGQIMSVGYAQLQDYNQIQNSGLDTKAFKNELISAGLAAGTLVKQEGKVVTANKGTEVTFKTLRNTLKDQWLTSDVLTNTLKKYGDTSTKVGALAQKNAQNVYTFTQLLSVIQESVGSSWGLTFQNLFGNLKEASTLFTAIYKATAGPKGFISAIGNARNAVLSGFKKMGGRENVITGLTEAFQILVKVIKPIHEAFVNIFPPITAKRLYELSEGFVDLVASLEPSKAQLNIIKRIFSGVFAALSIGISFIKAVATQFGKLFGLIGRGVGPFSEFAAKIADFVVGLDAAIKKGDLFNKFFERIEAAVAGVFPALEKVETAIVNFFKAFEKDPTGTLKSRFEALQGVLEKIKGPLASFGKAVVGVFQKIGNIIAPFVDAAKQAVGAFFDSLKEAFASGDYSGILDVLNTGLFAAVVLGIRKFMKSGLKIDFGGGKLKEAIGTIKEAFESLTGTLKAMQTQLQSKTLINIAIAVAILTGSLILLSAIDPKKLTTAMAGVATAMGSLVGAMALISKITGTSGFVKMPAIAASLIALSVAMLILAASVKIFASMDVAELGKGLGAVIILLGAMVGVSKLLDGSKANLAATGLAMILLATGMKIMASAVKDFASMSLADLGKGLGAVAVGLGIIGGAFRLMPKNVVAQSVGLLIVAAALKVMASALSDFGGMSMAEIGKSMLVLAVSLKLLSSALEGMQKSLPGAAALLIAAAALNVLAPALASMGSMDMATIGKGLLVMGASLFILSVALQSMQESLPGAAALIVAAFALSTITSVIQTLGNLPIAVILIALGTLAAVFVLLGVAGTVLAPIVPVIDALSVALLLIGGAMALVGLGALALGLGVLALATAFGIIAVQGTAGIAVLAAMLLLIPQLGIQLALGVVAFITTLASGAAQITVAVVALASALIAALATLVPQLTSLVGTILSALIVLIGTYVPQLQALGLRLLISLMAGIASAMPIISALAGIIIVRFINGLSNNLAGIINAGTNLVLKFLNAIGAASAKLADAGVKLVIKLVNSLTAAIRNNEGAMRTAGKSLASAIASGMTGGLSDAIGPVVRAAVNLAKSAYNAAKHALGINSPSKLFRYLGQGTGEGMVVGMDRSHSMVEGSAKDMATSAFTAVKKSMNGIGDAFASDTDINPTITPVLDLTKVTKDASSIGGLLDKNPVSADVSYQQAAGVANAQQAGADEAAVSTSAPTVTNNYEQTINAPLAPSPIEVYRNTKNLLSMTNAEIGGS